MLLRLFFFDLILPRCVSIYTVESTITLTLCWEEEYESEFDLNLKKEAEKV